MTNVKTLNVTRSFGALAPQTPRVSFTDKEYDTSNDPANPQMPFSAKNVSIVAHNSFASSSLPDTVGLWTIPTGRRYAPLNLSGFCTMSDDAAAKTDVYAPASGWTKKGYTRMSTSHDIIFSCGLRENVLTAPGLSDTTVMGDPCALSFRCSSDA